MVVVRMEKESEAIDMDEIMYKLQRGMGGGRGRRRETGRDRGEGGGRGGSERKKGEENRA